jgi:hypothetical protein
MPSPRILPAIGYEAEKDLHALCEREGESFREYRLRTASRATVIAEIREAIA